jgi:hypothetical protein
MSESLPPPPPPPGAAGPPPPPGWTPPPTPAAPDGSSRTGLVIGIVVAVLAALGLGAFFLFRDDNSEAAPELTDPVVPDVTILDVTVPEITVPDLTLPDITIPDLSVPDLSVPDFTLPSDGSLPGKLPPATQEPDGLGDDQQLDALAQDCFDGDMQSCDDLYQDAPIGSEYQDYGDTCAGRQPALTQRFCVNTFPD